MIGLRLIFAVVLSFAGLALSAFAQQKELEAWEIAPSGEQGDVIYDYDTGLAVATNGLIAK